MLVVLMTFAPERAARIRGITFIFVEIVHPRLVSPKNIINIIAITAPSPAALYEDQEHPDDQQREEDSEYQNYAGVMVHKWPLSGSALSLS